MCGNKHRAGRHNKSRISKHHILRTASDSVQHSVDKGPCLLHKHLRYTYKETYIGSNVHIIISSFKTYWKHLSSHPSAIFWGLHHRTHSQDFFCSSSDRFCCQVLQLEKKLVQQGTSTFHRKQKVSQSDRYLCFVLTVATCNLKMCDPTMPSGYVPKTLFHLFSQPALGVSSTSLQYQKRYPASQHCSNTDNSTICLKTLTPT